MATNLEHGPDNDAQIESARKRLSRGGRSFLSLPKLRSSSSSTSALSKRNSQALQPPDDSGEEDAPEPAVSSSAQEGETAARLPSIQMDGSLLASDLPPAHRTDPEFKWAVIYENQRGITLFSIPYYSRLALLPTDPYPFTAPSSTRISRKNANSNLSLHTYPLPSGDWRWVSKTWMIDMRSAEDGQVAHDGFEYNSVGFRQHGWRARTGTFAWVRRRRWVRLMYRPAKPTAVMPGATDDLDNPTHAPGTPKSISSVVSSSLLGQLDESLPDPFTIPVDQVFLGEDPESDYIRCSALMKRAGRDGKKIELWERWLGFRREEPPETTPQHSEWGANGEVGNLPVIPMTSDKDTNGGQEETPAKDLPLGAIAQVLSNHGSKILQSFTYPASRARLMAMVAQRDPIVLSKTGSHVQDGSFSNDMDFWSYRIEGTSLPDGA